METSDLPSYTLGIDLGPNSVGWAALADAGLEAMGARVFEQGVEGDLERGKEESKNVARRDARQIRRQTERRGRRLRKIYNVLAAADLLPAPTPDRHQALVALDVELGQRRPGGAHTLAYRLRALGLDEPLAPDELGRAFYHLAQRRGFKSNRKAPAKNGEDEGQVKEAIEQLRRRMEDVGARTLGEYFSRLDPVEARIRARWTGRDMYEREFDLLCERQRPHHPGRLTPEFIDKLRRAIFDQRPLKPVKPGQCELEKGERRSPLCHPLSQRIRLVQAVNNLDLRPPLEQGKGANVPISEDQRRLLIDALDRDGDLTMAAARKLLGITGKAHKGWKFNLEEGGEKRLIGNRTAEKIRGAIGERWEALDGATRERLVEDLRVSEDEPALAARLPADYGFSEEEAKRLAALRLEQGYAALSLKAMRKLLPLIERGERFAAARKRVYGESLTAGPALDFLPPVRKVFPNLRNPAVERSLTELRKVVNASIRRRGKPARVHIEVARDLKNPKKRREEIWKRNRDNQREREKGAEAITKDLGIPRPSRDDIQKYLLWQECNEECPYTGRRITLNALFSSDAPFEVEHIIPYSRSLDDSFNNKTLCAREANRDKTNRTPYEAFGQDPDLWEAILQRVRRFRGLAARAKLRRFERTELEEDAFTSRQLNDTSYASKLAGEYVGLLYGGRVDAEHKKRVQASAGRLTARLRAKWGLNGILNDGPTTDGGKRIKTRDDHRHHAVDALVVGLTTESQIQKLARESAADDERDSRRLDFEAPWSDFVASVRPLVESIVVSHRVDRRVQGKLHDDTLYSKPYSNRRNGKAVEMRRVRKRLENLGSEKEVASIVDDVVRKAVQDKLAELGGDPKKFADPKNLPTLANRNGAPTPIRSARIERVQSVRTIGQGPTERHVALAANHHLEVFAVLDKEGREKKWEGRLVSMLDAMRRVKEKRPVVDREGEPGWKFKFSLAPGETMEIDEPDGSRKLYIVRSISQKSGAGGKRPSPAIEYVPISDARQKKNIKEAKDWGSNPVNTFLTWRCKKVIVSPLGEVSYARD